MSSLDPRIDEQRQGTTRDKAPESEGSLVRSYKFSVKGEVVCSGMVKCLPGT